MDKAQESYNTNGGIKIPKNVHIEQKFRIRFVFKGESVHFADQLVP